MLRLEAVEANARIVASAKNGRNRYEVNRKAHLRHPLIDDYERAAPGGRSSAGAVHCVGPAVYRASLADVAASGAVLPCPRRAPARIAFRLEGQQAFDLL